MPKLKTKKAVRKRFRITSKGKIMKSNAFRRHLLGDKNAARKRKLRGRSVVDRADVPRLKRCLPYG